MRPIDIPVVGIGPGSQPTEADGAELNYLAMPRDMQTYRSGYLPEQDEIEGLQDAVQRLHQLHAALREYRQNDPPEVIDLAGLGEAERRFIDQVLGEGEVSARVNARESPAKIQETRLAGIWRVRAQGPHGGLQRDTLDVGHVPALLRHRAFDNAYSATDLRTPPPAGVLNAPPVLVELADHSSSWRAGDPPHVINLTLLPQTEEDLAYLQDRLGTGAAALLSRGYGNCRITATRMRHVWWVQYFNSEDALILNTLEVIDVPAVALAAMEDIEDSAQRLAEILETLA